MKLLKPTGYIGAATHDDASLFRLRMKRRARDVEELRKAKAEQEAREASASTVRPIKRKVMA